MLQPDLKYFSVIPGQVYTAGSKQIDQAEIRLDYLKYKVFKCNNRPFVGRRNTVIFPAHGEFGSNSLLPIYVIPRLMKDRYQGKRSIVCTWFGTKFLYQHLVDEVWELGEEYQYLREYSRAFHHDSINLKKCEKILRNYGNVVSYNEYAQVAVNEIYKDIEKYKKEAVWLPESSKEKHDRICNIIKPNSVGICARGRKTWGRNLPIEFYSKLINNLKDMGYNPVWIGEKTNILPCPDKSIVDFSIMEESKDLEYTFALVRQLRFGIQYWTASSRLYSMMGMPYIICESPDQVTQSGPGQEMERLSLLTKENKRKMIISHFWSAIENQDLLLEATNQAVKEIEDNNYNIIVPEKLVNHTGYMNYLIKNDNKFTV